MISSTDPSSQTNLTPRLQPPSLIASSKPITSPSSHQLLVSFTPDPFKHTSSHGSAYRGSKPSPSILYPTVDWQGLGGAAHECQQCCASRYRRRIYLQLSLGNLDYSEYLPDSSPSIAGSTRQLVDRTLWRYATVMMVQPLEVAKILLQVHVAREALDSSQQQDQSHTGYGDDQNEHVDSEDDEPNFFTSTSPRLSSISPQRGRAGRPSRSLGSRRDPRYPPDSEKPSTYPLQIKNTHSVLDALSSLASTSGALSLWRATNTTFIYSILHRTLETFLRSLLAGVLGIAESEISTPTPLAAPPSTSILTSTAPLASILISVTGTLISTLLLSPIDTARTRLILTPASLAPRSLLATIKTLPSPSYIIPSHLVPITFLTSTIPSLITTSGPLLLKNQLNIDPILNPSAWSVGTFSLSALDLLVRWPLETVLRRAQIATWTAPQGVPPRPSSGRKALETVVPVAQAYRGVMATVWGIVREEGTRGGGVEKDLVISGAGGKGKATKKGKVQKGQGVEGLYRGWRIGMWGLVGVWGASLIGGAGVGGESVAEGIPVHGKKF